MAKRNNDLDVARRVFEIEARAVADLGGRLDEAFVKAVNIVLSCGGKVVVTGMGKSGLICKKISATLSSTGTPAFFLHPAEGMHGDLGMVMRGDAVLAVSYSGETDELKQILPALKRMGVPIIAMTGHPDSALAHTADVVLDIRVEEEACSLGLAPTTSTTAALVMGDALAVTLLERRGFTQEDFAKFHPSGALGRKLLLRVEDLMHVGDQIPLVTLGAPMRQTVVEMSSKRLGVAGVCDREGRLVGVVTDGDLRRGMEKHQDLFSRSVEEVMTTNPKTIERTALAARALNLMETHSITQLFVTEAGNTDICVGVIHFHDLLKAGIA